MKYTININQFAAQRMNLSSDLIDLAIFDCICSFVHSDRCQKTIINGVQYFWVSPSFIIEELPILGIKTPRGISKRIDNLIADKLLERCPLNKELKNSYFTFGENYEELQFATWNDCSKSTWNDCSKYNNTSNNIYNKKEILKKKENSIIKSQLNFPYDSNKFRETWEILASMPKWKKKSVNALQMSLNRLGKYDESFSIELMETAISGEYQGVVFADTDKKYEDWQRRKTSTQPDKKESNVSYMLRQMQELEADWMQKDNPYKTNPDEQ